MSDKALAPFLRSFGHELRQPIGVALAALDQSARAIDRLTQRLNALTWLSDALSDESVAMALLRPRVISAALDAISTGSAVQRQLPNSLRVLAAPGTLEALLESLIDNARKHAPKADVTVRAQALGPTKKPWPATARIRFPGPAVLVTVADTGPGISTELRDSLFSPLPGKSGGGLRIGLWLCQLIVRAHGGELWLDEMERVVSL
jgi:two-component system sensor histidine kinase TctE